MNSFKNGLPEELRQAIYDPSKLQVNVFCQQYAPLLNWIAQAGLQGLLVEELLMSIRYSRSSSHKVTLVRLLDQLMLWHRWVVPYLQPYIVDVFVDVFVAVYNSNNSDAVETLKLIRKLWAGTLLPYSIESMRARVFDNVGVDIDYCFSKRSTEVVAQHYLMRLRMPKEDVTVHISRMSQNQPTPKTSLQNKDRKQQAKAAKEQEKCQTGPFIDLKRARVQDARDTSSQDRPRKIFVRHDRVLLEARDCSRYRSHSTKRDGLMVDEAKAMTQLRELNQMKKLSRYCCLQCGVRFPEQAAYNKHLLIHAKENKEIYLARNSKKPSQQERAPLLDVNDWIGATPQTSISVNDYESRHPDQPEAVCKFCMSCFSKTWNSDKETWVMEDYAEVETDTSTTDPIHIACWKIISAKP